MAKNDSIILDSIIDDRVALKIPSDKRDETFEYFCIEEILKDYNFTKDELQNGLVDGQNDGGIDGFFLIINGHCLTDTENFYWPRSSAELEVLLVTCKHHDTYKLAPLDSLVATLSELLDFSVGENELKGDYNTEILQKRLLLNQAYRKIASKISRFSFKVIYASRGNTSAIGDPIQARATQIEGIINSSFDNCEASFGFWGSAELIESFRKQPNFSLELPFIEYFGKGERYVLLCGLEDYFKFVTDEDNKLRRYLFDSNVRDFMGLNSVNEDIRDTLTNLSSPDFWWLNNGVTILATSGRVIGESIQMEDIQIVNGLQTTESIFNHFHSGSSDPAHRSVLVKVLVSQDAEIRDSIIRATNNQTNVQSPALHATDKIQRDIEDILLTAGLYYERRTNYYVNRNIPASEIISPLYLATAFTCLVLKDPTAAGTLKSRFMRKPEAYKRVFSEDINVKIYPAVVKILKRCDDFLENNRFAGQAGSDGFLKKWRHILSITVTANAFRRYDYSINELIAFDISQVEETTFDNIWRFLRDYNYPGMGTSRFGKTTIDKILLDAATEFSISGAKVLKIDKKIRPSRLPGNLTEAFLDRVNSLLPPQPWKIDDVPVVVAQLQSTPRLVNQAINVLVDRGLRSKQRDGIVYDKDNKIVAIDSSRVAQENVAIF